MPGVPSNKGCDACRQQKKKCDLVQPTCGRCTTRRIQCVGSGAQRFKFMNESVPSSAAKFQNPAQSRTSTSTPTTIVRTPTPNLTTLALISGLAETDIRFDISIYGPFFPSIPQRLGHNRALDAAIHAFTVSLPWVRNGHVHSPAMLTAYGRALSAVRSDLAKASSWKKPSAETICAVFVTTICHGWMARQDDLTPSHLGVLTCLLNAAAPYLGEWEEGGFEHTLLMTMAFLVLVTGFGDPRLRLDERLLRLQTPQMGPTTVQREGGRLEIFTLGALSRAAGLVQRPVVAGEGVEKERMYWREMTGVYGMVQRDCAKMRVILEQLDRAAAAGARKDWAHCRCYTVYGTLLWMAAMFNAILRTCAVPQPDWARMREEADVIVDEVTITAEKAARYRPLGSSSQPLYLGMGWAVTDCPVRKARIERCLEEYQHDFPSANWLELAHLMRDRVEMLERGGSLALGQVFSEDLGPQG